MSPRAVGGSTGRAQNPGWLQVCGDVPQGRVDDVRRHLACQDEVALPGQVLLFNAVGAEVHEALLELAGRQDRRVLAIHAGTMPLQGHQCWALLEAGASDVIDSPFGDGAAQAALARLQRWAQVEELLDSPAVAANLIGSSRAWRRLLRDLVEVAHFTQVNVLLVGESGTGKELVARLLHTLDTRPDKSQLVVLDCTTVTPELAGSEFFGHERGAYTGAAGPRDGAFALAHQGSLFLDEVGELPLAMQPQLLRVIQERSFKRLGGSRWERSQFRLVCATHRDLVAGIAQGSFRNDLYFRIAACVFRLPALRERPADVLPLAEHFLAEASPGGTAPPLHEAVRKHLQLRDYPGNVRELRQLMARIAARHTGPGSITVGDLPEDERPRGPGLSGPASDTELFETAIQRALCMGAGLKEIGTLAARTAIAVALREAGGNLQRAASRLGVTDRALQLRRAQGHSEQSGEAKAQAHAGSQAEITRI